jgi:hypothetical protein
MFGTCCRISAIAGGNIRDTIKDMVLANYRVPKGVSIGNSLQIQMLRVLHVFVTCFTLPDKQRNKQTHSMEQNPS